MVGENLSDRQKLLIGAGAVGLGVGVAHFGAHNVAGDPATFGRAGVTEAGLASMAAAGIGAALLATRV